MSLYSPSVSKHICCYRYSILFWKTTRYYIPSCNGFGRNFVEFKTPRLMIPWEKKWSDCVVGQPGASNWNHSTWKTKTIPWFLRTWRRKLSWIILNTPEVTFAFLSFTVMTQVLEIYVQCYIGLRYNEGRMHDENKNTHNSGNPTEATHTCIIISLIYTITKFFREISFITV